MKNINLLHITFAFYPYMNLGGVPRAVYDLVRIQRERHNVSVITNQIDKDSPESLPGVNVVYLKNLSSSMIYRYQFYSPVPRGELFPAIRRADVLHFHGHRNLLNDMIFYISRLFRKPYIITTHGTLHNYESKKIIKGIYDVITGDRFVNEAGFVVVHSESERNELLSAGIDEEKFRVVPNGISFDDLKTEPEDKNFFEKFNIGKNSKVVLFLGKITRRKGLDVALDAFRRIKGHNLRFVIAGEVLGNLPEKIKMDERVVYIGHLGQREKISAILSSELLLYPSIYEAFGYVPFEALYLEKPCIVGDDFGTSEYLSCVVPELFVSYGDSIELADLMIKLLKQEKFRDAVVRKGKRYIIKEFSAEKMAERYERIYRELL